MKNESKKSINIIQIVLLNIVILIGVYCVFFLKTGTPDVKTSVEDTSNATTTVTTTQTSSNTTQVATTAQTQIVTTTAQVTTTAPTQVVTTLAPTNTTQVVADTVQQTDSSIPEEMVDAIDIAVIGIKSLKSTLKDPSSLKVWSIKYTYDNIEYLFEIDYSAMNGFGGMVRDTYYFSANANTKMLTSDDESLGLEWDGTGMWVLGVETVMSRVD